MTCDRKGKDGTWGRRGGLSVEKQTSEKTERAMVKPKRTKRAVDGRVYRGLEGEKGGGGSFG